MHAWLLWTFNSINFKQKIIDEIKKLNTNMSNNKCKERNAIQQYVTGNTAQFQVPDLRGFHFKKKCLAKYVIYVNINDCSKLLKN